MDKIKLYRLKKDTPSHNAGAEFTRSACCEDDPHIYTMTPKYYVEECEKIQVPNGKFDDWFEEVVEEGGRERLVRYYCVNDAGGIGEGDDGDTGIDNYRHNTGNYFKTEKEAKQYRKYLLAKQRIKDSANGYVPNWEENEEYNYYAIYDWSDQEWRISWGEYIQIVGVVCFETEEELKKSLEKYKADWDFVRDYEVGIN